MQLRVPKNVGSGTRAVGVLGQKVHPVTWPPPSLGIILQLHTRGLSRGVWGPAHP